MRETSDLLHTLAIKISEEFWIDISQAKELIRGNTSQGLEWLKSNLNTGKKIDSTDLKNAINKASSAIEKLSKSKRESLKELLEEERYAPEKFEYKINKKIFSSEFLHRWMNPRGFTDQAIWLGLWLIDSTEAVILFTYWLGKWVLLTPYHIYLILTGKVEYKGFSRI